MVVDQALGRVGLQRKQPLARQPVVLAQRKAVGHA
jgi:hypothetical protein